MLAFLAALLATLAAQRVVVLWFDAPAGLALADGALIVIGMSATGAVFFARWMAVPAGLAAAGFLLWAAAPWTFPAAMVALGPAFMIVFGGFWRRDARRGVGWATCPNGQPMVVRRAVGPGGISPDAGERLASPSGRSTSRVRRLHAQVDSFAPVGGDARESRTPFTDRSRTAHSSRADQRFRAEPRADQPLARRSTSGRGAQAPAMGRHAAEMRARFLTEISGHVRPCKLAAGFPRFPAGVDSTAGATRNLLSEPAAELLFRACRGLPRLASKLLHAALIVAHTRDQAFLDDSVVATAIADLSHELPSNPDTLKPRTQTGTRSRR